MKKYIKQYVKNEKRIVKLCYQKGLLAEIRVDLKDLYWAEFKQGKKGRKRKKKYRYGDYLPEVHYCTTDYWGESDEHSVVGHIREMLYWKNVLYTEEDTDNPFAYPKSEFKYNGQLWFIKYLEKLPTVIRNSKINQILKRNDGE